MVKIFKKLFTPHPQRERLKQLEKQITHCTDYKLLVQLIKEHKKIKHENKTNRYQGIR